MCVTMQGFSPATAVNVYVNVAWVQAGFANAAPALAASYQVSDVTTVGTGALELKKQVRNVTQSGVFGINNQAKLGGTLEHLITYINNSASLVINDHNGVLHDVHQRPCLNKACQLECLPEKHAGRGGGGVFNWTNGGRFRRDPLQVHRPAEPGRYRQCVVSATVD